MDIANLLIQTLNSVQYGLLLFLLVSGLTLVFGIMGVINLAHGSFYMLGAYIAFGLAPLFDSLLIAVLAGIVIALVLGFVLEQLLFKWLYKRDHLDQVLLTFGLILIFEEVRSILWGDDVHGVKVPALWDFSIRLTDTLSYPAYRLMMSGVCILMALAMYWLIARTRLGMMIRAGASNREMAEALGVNINMLFAVVFALGTALAVFSGMLAAPMASVYPNMGAPILIICFVVVVIGGIGSVRGALIASLLIGFVDTFGKVFAPQLASMAVYIAMAAVLLWRPEGLFTKA
jgi:branched-chain amino acid transport system permease protein